MAGGKPEKHALNHLKPYIFGASVLEKDDREIREKEIFLDRLTAYPCFVGLPVTHLYEICAYPERSRLQAPATSVLSLMLDTITEHSVLPEHSLSITASASF